VRLYLLSDLAGALEPCGCTKDQLGGLDHFGAWVSQNRTRVAHAWVASAGPLFFMDEQLLPERADQDRTKADTMARVLRRLDFVAFAPGLNDWADGSDALARRASEAGALASVGAGAASSTTASTTVRDAGTVDGVPIKVGFIGYGQGVRAEGGPAVEEAVRRGVAKAKTDGANVLVALVAVGRGEAKRVADAVPELTAVVVGSTKADGEANTGTPQPERVGDVLIVQTANHLQSVAVLDLFVRQPPSSDKTIQFADATGLELAQRREQLTARIDDLHVKIAAWELDKSVGEADLRARRGDLARLEAERETLDVKPPPTRGSFFHYSIKEIRESLGRDVAIEGELLSYYKAVHEHNRVKFADRLPPEAGPDQPTYVGIEACSKCHPGARRVWDGTPHAHAYLSLSSQFKEFNLDCVGCHVTGYDMPGGSTVTHVDRLSDVQCEVCHGPGSRHVLNPTDKAWIVAKPSAFACLACHHAPHVEEFDPAAKLQRILGPGHGQPAK
jgi:Cytochrome c554 and c-prime